MARTQTGRDFRTNSRRKLTRQMYMCRLLPSSRILRSYWSRKLGQQLKILKTNYGKESEIVNAHVTNIMSLPVIYGSNPNKFYETLSPKLQALETMGKIKEVNGYVRMRLDKL